MTVETPAAITPAATTTPTDDHAAEPGTDWMQLAEYGFFIALIAGVFIVAYQLLTNKWQLLERITPGNANQNMPESE